MLSCDNEHKLAYADNITFIGIFNAVAKYLV